MSSTRWRALATRLRGEASRSADARSESDQRDLCTRSERESASKPRVPSTACLSSAWSGVTISAAAEGVAARTSAAKSAIVKSVSCPTPETTGALEATIARATASSLKAARSSSEPPPRASRMTSGWLYRLTARRAATMPAGASAPWTGVGARTTSASGKRRRSTFRTSCLYTPVGEVTTPMRAGQAGSGRLRSGANRPSASSWVFRRRNSWKRAPSPGGRRESA